MKQLTNLKQLRREYAKDNLGLIRTSHLHRVFASATAQHTYAMELASELLTGFRRSAPDVYAVEFSKRFMLPAYNELLQRENESIIPALPDQTKGGLLLSEAVYSDGKAIRIHVFENPTNHLKFAATVSKNELEANWKELYYQIMGDIYVGNCQDKKHGAYGILASYHPFFHDKTLTAKYFELPNTVAVMIHDRITQFDYLINDYLNYL